MRAGHTEAGCDLAGMAGREPAAVICEILKDDGEMARLPDLKVFAKQHGLKLGTIADLIHYRSSHESLIQKLGERRVTTPWGQFALTLYRDQVAQQLHIALKHGLVEPEKETLVRVHEPLNPLDWFATADDIHSWPLPRALEKIGQCDAGVLVMLNCANTSDGILASLGAEFGGTASSQTHAKAAKMDLRSYGIGAQILKDQGVRRMRVLAVPRKMPSMAGFGLENVGFAND
jgi:3,4-dihydroxy 2-butanone 4-phosphate synthase / GTP cyclohydrolase II